MKKCSSCKQQKEAAEFCRDKSTPDELARRCRACASAAFKERQSDPDWRKASAERKKLDRMDERVKQREIEYRKQCNADPVYKLAQAKRMRIWRASKPSAAKAIPKEKRREYMAAFKANNPEKRKAWSAVANALRRGKMEAKPCHCGAKAQAHHSDYSKPLDVTWLCRKHHLEQHQVIREALIKKQFSC